MGGSVRWRILDIYKKHQTISKEFKLLTGTSISLFLATRTIYPILPLYITQKGASKLELGLIISVLSFTGMLAKIPLGILAERIGKWPIIPIALASQSLCLLLYSFVGTNLIWFYPIRVFHALIVAAFAPTSISLASDLSPRGKEGERMGRFLTSFGITSMLGPFLCSFLSSFWGYEQIMQISAIIPSIGFVTFLFIRYKSSQSLFFAKKSPPQKKKIFPSLTALKAIVSSKNVLILSYLRATFFFTGAFITTLWAVYAEQSLFLTVSLISLLFGIKGITNTVFRFPAGKLADRIGYKKPLIIAYVLMSPIYFVLSEGGNFYILAAAMALFGVSHAMRAVTEWGLLGISTSPKNSSIASAYLSTMSNIGMALGAVAAGAFTIVLSTPTIFKLAALIILPGFFAPFLINQNRASRKSLKAYI